MFLIHAFHTREWSALLHQYETYRADLCMWKIVIGGP